MTKRLDITTDNDILLKNQTYINEIRKIVDDNEENKSIKKYFIETYGCQMNEHDSEKLKAMLEMMGFTESNALNDSDLIIYNTCAVRENAELRVYGNIGWVKSLKKKKPDLILALCGCMMQQPHIVEEIKNKYKFVDIVFGTHNIYNFPKYLLEKLSGNNRIIDVWDIDGEVIEGLSSQRKFNIKAYVNITYGCNNFCSYCIVPYTRGRERSRSSQAILNEVIELVNNGVKEVTLLGQNVNSYGKNLDETIAFAQLISKVAQVNGIERVRFMTSHPKDFSIELMNAIKDNKKIIPYIHLPIQSGSDRILKLMNRKYDTKQYLDLFNNLKSTIGEFTITTDLIIGFPGELDEDIDSTIEIIKKIGYDSAFTYIYSPRVGTPAASMEDNVSEEIKKERFNRVLKVVNELAVENNKKWVGRTLEILIDTIDEKKINTYTGRTIFNSIVSVSSEKNIFGEVVNAKIIKAKKFSLVGEIVNE
jgi:tRNA-2-methylthio-N6-dimethylallyladenosine synthase